jgi:hypothetical protein
VKIIRKLIVYHERCFGWKVDIMRGLHNHGLSDTLEGHTFVENLSANEQKYVVI